MNLYSKKHITDAVSAMKRSGRVAHGFLLTGEKGVGKKTALRSAKHQFVGELIKTDKHKIPRKEGFLWRIEGCFPGPLLGAGGFCG